MKPQVSIIIPAFNEINFCYQCIQSLLAHTTPVYKLILVDNGSTDGVGEFFDTVPDATVVHTGRNLGFAGGVNAGLEFAKGHVVLLNSDTLLPPGWLERLLAPIEKEPRIGMVGPRTNCASGSQQISNLNFAAESEMHFYAESRARDYAGVIRDVARLVGFCLLIRDRTLQQVGRFDEAYGIGNFEDDDYCVRALRAGWRLCVAEDAFVFHYGSRTFAGMGLTPSDYDRLIRKNEALFQEKLQPAPEERADSVRQARALAEEGTGAYSSGELERACELLSRAILLAPDNAQWHNDLGAALWAVGESAKAMRQFQRALELQPEYPEARDNLIAAQAALGGAG